MPKVKIEKSPRLTDLRQFLPPQIADTCSNPDSTTCQYSKEKETSNTGLIIGIVVGAVVGVIVVVAAVIVGIYCYQRNQKEKAKAKPPAAALAEKQEKRAEGSAEIIANN